ncbi:ABC transporter substrate-binding protein [Oceanibacterium hippocampi]|uniref:Spermidine/putrescine-binding periplasmic protein n=1 Tax=Oceanibacterium hippocampi TaxID=745714 RepID=A0A1Y5R9G7_9PROT|nr:ABC transporter substrate-binding protein [Oceanibacterium hippocampi]SLN11096.1 Spermidine/putrescine-binding periplasmic protein precursor [Oceanibacterium hippocampi]
MKTIDKTHQGASGRAHGVTRRHVLAGAAALGASAVAAPFIRPARAAEPLKVGTYGGYFEESFVKHVYPEFTKATGIEVQSIAEPTGSTWLVQLENAARAGIAPADVSMMAGVPRLRGASAKLWAPLDTAKIPNLANVSSGFIEKYDDGSTYGVGAVSWYITLCSNTKTFPDAPASWADMWAADKKDTLGLLALPQNSFLLEITATTYFGGPDILKTQEGIEKVLAKLAEVKPNVRLWYKDEGTFQQALQDGEIPMGQYYHDVTGLAAADGFPVRSTFPKEGGVVDSGFWVVSKASKMLDQAQTFIDYTSSPAVQATLARKVGTAPVVARKHLDLSDDEFAAVASDIPPIVPQYDIYLKWGDWISEKWTAMITAG